MAELSTSNRPWVIITPVYEDAASFMQWCQEIAAAELPVTPYIVAVDDGSIRAAPQIQHIAAAGLPGRILRLRRNVGMNVAIAVGLAQAAGKHGADAQSWGGAAVLDCDGEDVPAQLPTLLAALVSEDADFAVAARRKRSEGRRFRLLYWVYKLIFRILTGHVIKSGNFMACRPRGLARLAVMSESWSHLPGAVIRSKLPRTEVPLDRGLRYAGTSHMSLIKLILHGVRAVAVFGDAVLTRMTVVCACSALLSVMIFGVAVTLKLTGIATPGWLTFVTGFAVMVFLQTGILTLITLLMGGTNIHSLQRMHETADALVASVEHTGEQVLADDAQ